MVSVIILGTARGSSRDCSFCAVRIKHTTADCVDIDVVVDDSQPSRDMYPLTCFDVRLWSQSRPFTSCIRVVPRGLITSSGVSESAVGRALAPGAWCKCTPACVCVPGVGYASAAGSEGCPRGLADENFADRWPKFSRVVCGWPTSLSCPRFQHTKCNALLSRILLIQPHSCLIAVSMVVARHLRGLAAGDSRSDCGWTFVARAKCCITSTFGLAR